MMELERADRLAPGVEANAKRLHGELVRHGKVSVLYLDAKGFPAPTAAQRKQIEGCISG